MRPVAYRVAEQPVARVAQAGQDVALLVELAVERGGEDRHVGMGLEHRAGRPSGAATRQRKRIRRAPAVLERAHRGHRRAAGGEHRVEHEEVALHLGRGDLEVVVHRLERVVVAIEADVADPGRRE